MIDFSSTAKEERGIAFILLRKGGTCEGYQSPRHSYTPHRERKREKIKFVSPSQFVIVCMPSATSHKKACYTHYIMERERALLF